ncbi:D-alanyl-D-alanine carboxypeptidase, partial [Candidatus Daviesbacteria bacterium]|nr:D-alanyl-D-alanine carboxypeptidase [Candidatus Daviesbacteria bacterium]
MKKLTFLSVVLVILVSFLVLNLTEKMGHTNLVSPILRKENVLGINQWFPKGDISQQDALLITAKAAFFTDTKNGQALYSKNARKKLPIASLVKVMTVLIALEHKNMDDWLQVSQRAADMEPDKMFLIAGEKLVLKEFLAGIFLISANDAAEVLAESVTGSREEFIELMNDKAKQLGMNDTYFANP